MTKPLYGIKVSKIGFNVTNLDQKTIGGNNSQKAIPHVEYSLALPYLLGARVQVQRYQTIALTLNQNPTNAVISCIHEVSNLFEDLHTIYCYLKKCGVNHQFHELIHMVRNHIRHDFRDQKKDEKQNRTNDRKERYKLLKIDSRLLTSLGFSLEFIKVGETEITISEMVDYLNWAEDTIAKVMSEAKVKGLIK